MRVVKEQACEWGVVDWWRGLARVAAMMAQVFDTKRRALGKGLESLLPTVRAAAVPAPEDGPPVEVVGWGRPLEVALEMIDRNPLQTRTHFDGPKLKELAASIKHSGVVQPVVVKAMPGGRYQLIMGERRFLASIEAGKATIPAIVRQATDLQAIEMTIVENLQRADLNPMEQARAYERLGRDFNLTQEQMAMRTGKDRASVTNYLRLLKLPRGVQEQVETGELTFGHGRALLGLEDEAAIEAAAAVVLKQGMSVRETEEYVYRLLSPERGSGGGEAGRGPARPVEAVDPNVRAAEERLRETLGLKVSIQDRRGRGRVIIEYAGLEDFDAILEALSAGSRE